MDGILRLNDYDIGSNPAAGAHDPSMMWDPITQKYYSYCTDVEGPLLGIKDRIGIPVRSTEDLVHFTYHGTVLSRAAIREGRDNGPLYRRTVNFWAPYCEYVRGEYRLYYSATRAFGSSESRIWLAVADHPLGPFENRGVVADTWGTDDTYPNAIDPHIIWDEDRCYLVYGSFFGGIYLKELDPATGLPLDGQSKTLGICLSRKSNPPVIDGPEGSAIIFVPETGYFYFFQSYGWLGNFYDIRVGRSRTVTGPYLDFQGRDLKEKSLGLKLANSYRFTCSRPYIGSTQPRWQWGGFRGPGHGVPFFDPVRKQYFFVHHIRDGARCNMHLDDFEKRESYKKHYLMVRPMFFRDGWPLLGPEPYTGESLEVLALQNAADSSEPLASQNAADRPEPLASQQAAGSWELIFLDDENNDQKLSKVVELSAEDALLQRGVIYACWDYENQQPTLALSGLTEDGTAYWGKKR